MSLPTWTPDALSYDAWPLSGDCWRLSEARHRISTLKLVDTLAELDLLESLMEESKPIMPPECRHLHYLLAAPFRYGAAYPTGSRFRRAGRSPGVFYAAETVQTAVAEAAFHRLLFFAESPDTPWPQDAIEFTAFAASIRTRRSLDLTSPPFRGQQGHWTHPTDYAACQTMADMARDARIDAIRYRSVRDPEGGVNLAVLTCRAFAASEPIQLQTWHLRFGSGGVQALAAFPPLGLDYGRADFGRDPRIATMNWDR